MSSRSPPVLTQARARAPLHLDSVLHMQHVEFTVDRRSGGFPLTAVEKSRECGCACLSRILPGCLGFVSFHIRSSNTVTLRTHTILPSVVVDSFSIHTNVLLALQDFHIQDSEVRVLSLCQCLPEESREETGFHLRGWKMADDEYLHEV